MSGESNNDKKLNHTLKSVCEILRNNLIDNWFIMFGTLLGITRNGSCIDGDDDIDIMINHDYNHLRSVFERNGFTFTSGFGIGNSELILKSNSSKDYCSIDFYMCSVSNSNYFCQWQNVEVRDVSIVKCDWCSTILNTPNNPVVRLERMYGSDWRTPITYTHADQVRKSREVNSIYNISTKSIV